MDVYTNSNNISNTTTVKCMLSHHINDNNWHVYVKNDKLMLNDY